MNYAPPEPNYRHFKLGFIFSTSYLPYLTHRGGGRGNGDRLFLCPIQ
jgi:hypothetical protein